MARWFALALLIIGCEQDPPEHNYNRTGSTDGCSDEDACYAIPGGQVCCDAGEVCCAQQRDCLPEGESCEAPQPVDLELALDVLANPPQIAFTTATACDVAA